MFMLENLNAALFMLVEIINSSMETSLSIEMTEADMLVKAALCVILFNALCYCLGLPRQSS